MPSLNAILAAAAAVTARAVVHAMTRATSVTGFDCYADRYRLR
jgi:L-aminopeptidase/D-esterase-like protein